MTKRKILSIPQSFLLYIVVIFASSAIIMSSLYLYLEYSAFKQKSEIKKSSYIKEQKKLVENEVDKVLKHITISRDIRFNQINETLKYRANQAYLLIENLYNTHKTKYDKEAIIQMAREALRPLQSKKVRSDYFIIRTNGEEILFPSKPEFEGTNFLDMPDSTEKNIIKQEIKIALEQGEGFIKGKSHLFTKNSPFTSSSVNYIKYFKPLKIIIGTGEYIPNIEKDIKKEALLYIKNVKYGINQQLFINDKHGNVIISKSDKYNKGDNIFHLKDKKGLNLIKTEIEKSKNPKGGFTTFHWTNKLNNHIDKNISFVKSYSQWDWVVGAWFDLTRIENEINNSILKMEKNQMKKATSILFLIFLSHIIIFLIFKYITNKTKKNTTIFIQLFEKAIQTNSYINKGLLNYSEFHKIADAANKIIKNKKGLDEALKKSELKFKSLFEIAPIMILGIDFNNKITLWNNECEKITGYSLSDIQTTNEPIKMLLKYKKDYHNLLSHLLKPDGQFSEYTIINKNNEEQTQFWAGFKSPAGLIIGVGYDTTKLTKTLQELNITANKLKKANLTKDKFISIIAHDLKNPFNAILGFTNLLCSNYSNLDDETKLDIIKDIHHSAKLNFNLLEKMFEWSMIQSDKIAFNPKELNLQNIIQDSIAFASYQANQKKINLKSDNLTGINIFADKNMLESLLRNLISNAIKFTPVGGLITIHAKNLQDKIELSVKDSGLGISQENIEKLFQIDTKIQTKGTKNEKGTGLGLLICKEFIDKHKGKIWVKSDPGNGSEFIINFPKQNN